MAPLCRVFKRNDPCCSGTKKRTNLRGMSEALFVCSHCNLPKPQSRFDEKICEDRIRPVTSWCASCRSDGYFQKRYPTPCSTCGRHRKLLSNGVCVKCNEEVGLRQCRKCGFLLPSLLSFHRKKKTCEQCSRPSEEEAERPLQQAHGLPFQTTENERGSSLDQKDSQQVP